MRWIGLKQKWMPVLKGEQLRRSSYRYFLFPLALFYWGVIFWRNLFYKIGFFVSKRLPCTVISIGNLTVGGTGKTPAVIYLASLLKKHQKKVAVLSRGYGRKSTGTILVSDGSAIQANWMKVGDEPALMAQKLPGIPIVVDEDRFRGGLYLIEKFNPEFIVLDDAFQHRSLKRDIDIVLINSGDRPEDYKLLPYGILREPLNQLNRADILLLTKSNLHHPHPFIQNKLGELEIPVFKSNVVHGGELAGDLPKFKMISDFNGKKAIAVSAVGDPAGFQKTLEAAQVIVAEHIQYPDHHAYTINDIQDIKQAVANSGAEAILTTEKDFVKLEELEIPNLPIYALPVMFEPEEQGEEFILKALGLN